MSTKRSTRAAARDDKESGISKREREANILDRTRTQPNYRQVNVVKLFFDFDFTICFYFVRNVVVAAFFSLVKINNCLWTAVNLFFCSFLEIEIILELIGNVFFKKCHISTCQCMIAHFSYQFF